MVHYRASNIYAPEKKGFSIYVDRRHVGKWRASRAWPDKQMRYATFYSYEDCKAWLDSLPEVIEHRAKGVNDIYG